MSEMVETVQVTKLDVVETFKDGVAISIRNLAPILINFILWVVTIWIPYLNVGTTIGMFIGIVAMASKGEVISSTEIFNPKYRKYIGEFFLTGGLMYLGIFVGVIFLIIPGLVIAFAWDLALLLVIDKGKNPTESLTLSNNLTYGYKWKMFFVYLILGIATGILNAVFGMIWGGLVAIVAICQIILQVGLKASIYRQLAGDTE